MALKIVGAGMEKTETALLKIAFQTLNIGHCQHMTEMMKKLVTVGTGIESQFHSILNQSRF